MFCLENCCVLLYLTMSYVQKKKEFVFKTHQKMIKGVQLAKIEAVPQGCAHNPPFYSPSHLAFHSPILPCSEIV